ncbi:SdrD B-like domain-containing protein [Maribacter sp. 2307UL18-2]|uniref:SdrD B-like domain-containing protein n=1 Tax=Maribacter sp. 2307UL18-2 TaxID=3386274 RepID=UPI0039BD4E54
MNKNLHYHSNINIETTRVKGYLLAFLLLLMGPAGTLLVAQQTNCDLTVDIDVIQKNCQGEALLTTDVYSGNTCQEVISSYKIKDASTEGKSCFPTWGTGVIFQKGGDCKGLHDIWRAGTDLMLQEFSNNTAKISGSVIDPNGVVGTVNIKLYDKANNGNTWQDHCYQVGIAADPRTFYKSFSGTITANGRTMTVELKDIKQHYILADGAGFQQGQYGIGAWTGGTFGECTEWFGTLEPMNTGPSRQDLTYLWSTGETTPSITVTQSGNYTVTVKGCDNCTDMRSVYVDIDTVTAEVGEDKNICRGDSTTLTVTGEGTYLWSTGETKQTIEVAPEVDTTYSVTVTNGSCEATEEVTVTVENKIVIGDYVWLDKNQNGLQDDGSAGVNNITVELYQCGGDLVDMTTSADDSDGKAGYYQFEVCSNSGDYYIVFGAEPEKFEFTSALAGDSSLDSNAEEDGKTNCFNISEENDLTIDAGLRLKEVCSITVDAGKSRPICRNSGQVIELTATIQDESDACEGGCVYPILEQERCYGPTGSFEIWLTSIGRTSAKFSASEQRFERLANGDARYTAQATNGVDKIDVDVTFSGYTKTPTLGSPKLNDCQDYDASDWEYWTDWNGTITSENHGVYKVTMLGAPFQMGVGADVVRSGFGASGWFSTEGGDGYYSNGDINITLAECQENGVEYRWTTRDGNIISDPYKKTISVDQPGTYVFEAMNCMDCFAEDKIVVGEVNCNKTPVNDNPTKISKVYPIPVASGDALTLEFGTITPKLAGKKSLGPQLKEDVKVVVYDINGRMVSVPRSFKMIDGKATIHLDINNIPSGKYIVKAQGHYWAESKHFLVN